MNFVYRCFFNSLIGKLELRDESLMCRVYFCGRDHESTPVDTVINDLDCIHPNQELWMEIRRRVDPTGTICFEADDTTFKLEEPTAKRPCFVIIFWGAWPAMRFSVSPPLQKQYQLLELGWQGVISGKDGRVLEVSSYEEEALEF